MKKSMTLRKQLSIFLALIVVFQSVALVVSLWATQVFSKLDAEALRVLQNTTAIRAEKFNEASGGMIDNLKLELEKLTLELTSLAEEAGIRPDQLYRDDLSYNAVALSASESLVAILKKNQVTGAFVILNGSNADKENQAAHSLVYLRNTTPEVQEVTNYTLERGPTAIAKNYQIATSIHWGLDLLAEPENNNFDFYEQTIWASETFKGSEIERFAYWSEPKDILKDNQQVITYTMPLLDQEEEAYGVVGIEIDLPYFSRHYLPDSDLLYDNSFYVMANQRDQILDFSYFIPSGLLAETYLEKGQELSLKALGDGIYETRLNKLGPMYCSLKALKLYSGNSPFNEQNWTLACFVPTANLTENSATVKNKMLWSIVITTLLALSGVFLLVYLFTRKIAGLSDDVKNLSPYDEIQFLPTGMREIDDLTAAIKLLNQSLVDTSRTTSKILELSLLPIGGYEVLNDSRHVILTDFLYWLLHIDPGSMILKEEWQTYRYKLIKNPVKEHANIYGYDDESGGGRLWLRIVEAKSPIGVVGVVLDVTNEFEENQRLANELDYDALTGLYNKTALRRKVKEKINDQPEQVGAMIFIDLDNLKKVNDRFGHDVGDRLLIKAGQIFRYFEAFGGLVSRISGDEFVIYLHGFKSQDDLRDIIGGFIDHAAGAELMTADQKSRPICFSSGLAWYPEDARAVGELLKCADGAMYHAKKNEKGCLCYYSQIKEAKRVIESKDE